MPSNEELIRAIFSGVQGRGTAATREAVHPNFGPIIESALEDLRRSFPDVAYEVTDILSEGDAVGFQYRAKGTHKGEYDGIKPTGKTVSWAGAGVARVTEGKVTDLQVTENAWARSLQLGVIPTVAEPSITGTWDGKVYGIPLQMKVTQAPGSTTFTGTLAIPGILPDPIPFDGINAYPSVTGKGSYQGKTYTFKGTWTGPNEIKGTIAELPGSDITLIRR